MIVSITFCLNAMAQVGFSEGKYTVDGRTFEIMFSDINANRMTVISKLPQYKEGYPLPEGPTPPLMVRRSDINVDTVADRQVFHEVLKGKLGELATNSEKIVIYYVFGQDGNIVDISFYILPRNTVITPEELALVDKRLRNEVTASFKGPDYLNWPVIFYGRDIRF